jgi:hypothetical protein
MQKCIDDLGLTGYQGLKNPLEILIRVSFLGMSAPVLHDLT